MSNSRIFILIIYFLNYIKIFLTIYIYIYIYIYFKLYLSGVLGVWMTYVFDLGLIIYYIMKVNLTFPRQRLWETTKIEITSTY